MQLWDSKTGKLVREVAHGQLPDYVAFAAHSPYLISSAQGLIRIWAYPQLRELAKWKAAAGLHSIALSPDGSTVAAVDEQKIGLWEVPSGKRLATIAPDGEPTSVAFTPDSRAVVAVSSIAEGASLTQAWSWPGLKIITRFPAGFGTQPEISFSPDGDYLVLRQSDHLERYLWRTEDLIPQGCRTLIEITADRSGLPHWCEALQSRVPQQVSVAPRAEARIRRPH